MAAAAMRRDGAPMHDGIAIDFLDAHRAAIPRLAVWHHAEWGGLYDHWTLAVCRAELEDQATRRGLPTCLAASRDGDLLGSVSLVLEDAPELADQGSPWLASLYVRPDARGGGLGALLVRAAVAHAAAQGVDELFLFTPAHRDFYARLGWQPMLRTTLKGTPVDLMRIVPANAGAQA
jgi:N-acetylglutamate synthase-like GNAT family acetyltransferase